MPAARTGAVHRFSNDGYVFFPVLASGTPGDEYRIKQAFPAKYSLLVI
jgi:hypothetical protein